MELISDGNNLSKLLVNFTNDHDNMSFAVAWASSTTEVFETILHNRNKIVHGVFGTHFCQTHPDVLNRFIGFENVRFILEQPQSKGTFHPKVYLFYSGIKNWDLVIGSANMTHAAFGANQELCLYISSGEKCQTLFKQAQKAIETMWTNGLVMDNENAEQYLNRYNEKNDIIIRGTEIHTDVTEIMTWDWKEYFERVTADKNQHISKRLTVLEAARKQFNNKSFHDMDIDWRLAIAGRKIEDCNGLPFFWFGYISHRLIAYQNKIKNNNIKISNALDHINTDGDVTHDDYIAYLNEFRNAFLPGEGCGKTILTRLLSFKRPDYFICLNSKNIESLCLKFNIRIKSIRRSNFEKYWPTLISRIVNSTWWKKEESELKTDLERRVWRCRAAMLDTVCYHIGNNNDDEDE
jgi:HKD family nuclease